MSAPAAAIEMKEQGEREMKRGFMLATCAVIGLCVLASTGLARKEVTLKKVTLSGGKEIEGKAKIAADNVIIELAHGGGELTLPLDRVDTVVESESGKAVYAEGKRRTGYGVIEIGTILYPGETTRRRGMEGEGMMGEGMMGEGMMGEGGYGGMGYGGGMMPGEGGMGYGGEGGMGYGGPSGGGMGYGGPSGGGMGYGGEGGMGYGGPSGGGMGYGGPSGGGMGYGGPSGGGMGYGGPSGGGMGYGGPSGGGQDRRYR